jgi:hypothetical protein
MVLRFIRGDVVSAHCKKLSLGLVTSVFFVNVLAACVGVATLELRPRPMLFRISAAALIHIFLVTFSRSFCTCIVVVGWNSLGVSKRRKWDKHKIQTRTYNLTPQRVPSLYWNRSVVLQYHLDRGYQGTIRGSTTTRI